MFSDTEVGLVLAHDRELRAHTNQAQGLLDQKNDELRIAYDRIRKLQAALITESAHSAGLTAQVLAFAAAVPNDPLMKETGFKLSDGRPEREISRVYDRAFDEKARQMGIQDPKRLRETEK